MTYKVGRCRLQDILNSKKMTQRMLAEKLKMKPQQLQHYIQNHHVMSFETARNIAEALDWDITDLYEWHIDDKE